MHRICYEVEDADLSCAYLCNKRFCGMLGMNYGASVCIASLTFPCATLISEVFPPSFHPMNILNPSFDKINYVSFQVRNFLLDLNKYPPSYKTKGVPSVMWGLPPGSLTFPTQPQKCKKPVIW